MLENIYKIIKCHQLIHVGSADSSSVVWMLKALKSRTLSNIYCLGLHNLPLKKPRLCSCSCFCCISFFFLWLRHPPSKREKTNSAEYFRQPLICTTRTSRQPTGSSAELIQTLLRPNFITDSNDQSVPDNPATTENYFLQSGQIREKVQKESESAICGFSSDFFFFYF